MINRANWQLTRGYLKYRAEVDQISASSICLEETWLRHLLEWADDRSFEQVKKIRPTLPEYILTARKNGEKQLSPVYIKKVISAARCFFEWVVKHRRGFAAIITPAWLDTLKPTRLEAEIKEHEAVTLDEIRAIAAAHVYTLRDKRNRAAAVFWFLSGIRIGAFVTLPINAIDLSGLSVRQWPSLGVHTKFTKKATTFFLNIPEFLAVVKEWDQQVKKVLPGESYWFALLNPETGLLDPTIREVGKHRQSRAIKDLRDWLYRVGLPYHSPHKFRHGHAVYALKQSKDIADLKAGSMNLMYSNLSITDGVYGVLSTADVGQRIGGLGRQFETGQSSQVDLADQLIKLAMQLKQRVK